ncbi:DgyrCDS5989 [Dimorphilus gyrociliatus]|uniref:peptide chain release factor N(5)-glutamine methyltransferase n=1 Tax=Dimorphilus gyrociliatus TaxID=2664684 RepID=A0A7I8VLL7_9ANNE|nr:DgyrCDS5989 [Dimorphilus gyrociliatus]
MNIRALYRLFTSEGIPEPLSSAKYILSFAAQNRHKIKRGEAEKPGYDNDTDVTDDKVKRVYKMIWKRLERQPMQYILGEWQWGNIELFVKKPVFIPRPETEDLVNLSIDKIRNSFPAKEVTGLDLCCGSGAIGISLLKNISNLQQITSIDMSNQACELTTLNSEKNNVSSKMTVLQARIDELPGILKRKYDFIVTNPPYVPDIDMEYIEDEVAIYEDPIALRGGHDGLNVIRKIIEVAPKFLKESGLIFMEMDSSHYKYIPNLLKDLNSPLTHISNEKDRFGLYRFSIFTLKD